MLTLFDIAIGLSILMIKADARLRHERFLFFLEIFPTFIRPTSRPWCKLIDGPEELGYDLVPASEFDFESDPFSCRPIERRDVFPEGVPVHAN